MSFWGVVLFSFCLKLGYFHHLTVIAHPLLTKSVTLVDTFVCVLNGTDGLISIFSIYGSVCNLGLIVAIGKI